MLTLEQLIRVIKFESALDQSRDRGCFGSFDTDGRACHSHSEPESRTNGTSEAPMVESTNLHSGERLYHVGYKLEEYKRLDEEVTIAGVKHQTYQHPENGEVVYIKEEARSA